jgi:D-alanyl-D-alanine carboxypeptidase
VNDLIRRALIKAFSAFAAILLVGVAVVFAAGRLGTDHTATAGSTPGGSPSSDATPPSATPDAFLAWVPGGLPSGFGERLASLRLVRGASVAKAGVSWMTRSLDAAGDPVDQPSAPYSIPLDTTGVDVATFAPFLPKGPQRGLVARLHAGESVLSETASTLRGLGEGATLEFDTGPDLTVAGILPDVLMGGYELLVPLGTGELLGITSDAYALFRPGTADQPTVEDVQDQLRSLVSPSARYPAVEVRAPGTTTYLRANDAVPPPASYKERFGEFSALIDTTENHDLDLETSWVDTHTETRTLPVFGTVQCAPRVLFFLKQAAAALADQGATDAVTEVGDCFADTWIPGNPEGALTPHLWGAAIDVNGFANPPGEQPDLDDRVVEAMQSSGFAWGGDAAWPEGDHFVFVGTASGA